MSISLHLPPATIPIQTETRFEANFNAPTVNRYDFNTSANTGVEVLELFRGSIYVLERINFSLDIDEADFKKSIPTDQTNVEVPTLSLRHFKRNQQIWQKPIPFINYVDNLEIVSYVLAAESNDKVIANFRGQLVQVAGTTGDATITAQVQLNWYQVTDTGWYQKFLDTKSQLNLGEHLMRGRA